MYYLQPSLGRYCVLYTRVQTVDCENMRPVLVAVIIYVWCKRVLFTCVLLTVTLYETCVTASYTSVLRSIITMTSFSFFVNR